LLFSLWAGLNVLFLAGDLVTTYLMLELIAVCGALLVTLRGDRGSLLAGTRYFYAELAASTTMLVGVALVWSQTGTVTYAELGAALDTAPAGTAVGRPDSPWSPPGCCSRCPWRRCTSGCPPPTPSRRARSAPCSRP
jgi:NADH:ubiquinone oxidoreductase subunit 5 (subunit L)/multisubunit Na+/H+ antiporter MnhA subunit